MNRIVVVNVSRMISFSAMTITIIGLIVGCGLAVAQVTNHSQSNDGIAIWQGSATQQSPAGATEQSPGHKYFTDVVLVNQNGERMRFYSDLLQGRVVIIKSFFATCQASWLPMNRNLERVG